MIIWTELWLKVVSPTDPGMRTEIGQPFINSRLSCSGFVTYATLHYAKRVDNQSHTDNSLLLYFTDDTTSDMTAWIPDRNNVAIINKYTIIKASPSDFGLQDDKISPPTYRTSSTYLVVHKRVLSRKVYVLKRLHCRKVYRLKRVLSRNQ